MTLCKMNNCRMKWQTNIHKLDCPAANGSLEPNSILQISKGQKKQYNLKKCLIIQARKVSVFLLALQSYKKLIHRQKSESFKPRLIFTIMFLYLIQELSTFS